MKILIVRSTPNKVNMQTYNLQEVGLAKSLVRKGHQCDVAYYCGKEPDHRDTIEFADGLSLEILWLHGYGMFYEGIYPSLKKYVGDYDIIQIGGYTGITSWWLNTRAKGKTVNYQGPYFHKENLGDIRKAKILDATLLRISNKKNMVVATKSVLATDYIRSKGILDVTTIGVGIDLDNLLRTQDDIYDHEFIRRLRQRKGTGKYLLYIGALEERRNIPFLLDVFKKVCDSNPECQLVLIGKGHPDYTSACEQKIRNLSLSDRIIRCERLEQKYLKAVYEYSEAFLLPTRYEIFGMVLLEAMYFGLPVFTTYNGGSSTLMNAENGIVLESLDAETWAEKIISVLNNENLANKIGENARKTITEKYTWDALADRFLEVYAKRLNGHLPFNAT